MENNTLKSGSQLKNGEYSIVRVLGQGGFGITYEGQQNNLKRRVAIKEFFMKDSCQRDEDSSKVTVPTVSNRELVERFKQKFIREAQMIAGFDNEHIVRIHDVFEENGTAYYVMEFLGGGSLLELVKSKGSLRESTAVDYVRQIANALSYLHEQNTLHLDVKPANILLNQQGQLKLIDFGISKHYDEAGSQTSSSPVGISKGYAPLEQYQQGGDVSKFTPATDIYALGATLYYLVTGTVPPDASEVANEGLELPATLSSSVKQAITKAMSFRKKDRPQSVEAFLGLLGENHLIEKTQKKEDEMQVEETVIIDAPKPTPEPTPDTVTSSEAIPDSAPKRKFPKWLWGVVPAAVVIILCIIFWPKSKADMPVEQKPETEEIIEHTSEQSQQVPKVELKTNPTPREGKTVTSEKSEVKPYIENGVNLGCGIAVLGDWNGDGRQTTLYWAPVNCGYEEKGKVNSDSDHRLGKLYQWGAGDSSLPYYYEGRKVVAQEMYYDTRTPSPWYNEDVIDGTTSDKWNHGQGPCPKGWRLPTSEEFKVLCAGKNGKYGWVSDGSCPGAEFFGANRDKTPGKGVFFPAAGYLSLYDGRAYSRGSQGNYWSSTPNPDVSGYACSLYFSSSYMFPQFFIYRGDAFSVRCVSE